MEITLSGRWRNLGQVCEGYYIMPITYDYYNPFYRCCFSGTNIISVKCSHSSTLLFGCFELNPYLEMNKNIKYFKFLSNRASSIRVNPSHQREALQAYCLLFSDNNKLSAESALHIHAAFQCQ